jgi:hypothetical protein
MTKEQAFEEIEKIKAMSNSQAITLGKSMINEILSKAKDGWFRITNSRRVENHWNSFVDGVYKGSKGGIFVDVYVQDDSTDTNVGEYFNTFFSDDRRDVEVRSNCGKARYDYNERADVMRSILIDYLYWDIIDREERERKQKVATLFKNTLVNPILNEFYEYYGLKYKYSTWAYGGKSREYEAYLYAKKALEKYTQENADELLGKSDEELTKIYRKFFGQAMDEYFKNN